ncbi:hypothetical protein EPN90_04045 [Patescibacteria group bacterium]|nr:MAG: hypothetical protein EPN90_04045 [Patescibacteria group bacterium]
MKISRRIGERGTVLLLSLFVLSSVMLAATAVSAIIIRDLRASRLVDSGHLAFYAAESGLEQALYLLRRTDTLLNAIKSGDGSLNNNSAWRRQVLAGEPEFYIPLLKPNDFTEIDLFDPENLAAKQNIESISFEWQDNCNGCTTLETSYAQWLAVGSGLTWPPVDYKDTFWKFQRQRSLGVPWCLNDLTADFNYRFRVKNLATPVTAAEPIKNLRVRVWGNNDCTAAKDVPSRVFINVTGNFAGAEQKLTAAMQRAEPLSALWNYVLWSEGDIVK